MNIDKMGTFCLTVSCTTSSEVDTVDSGIVDLVAEDFKLVLVVGLRYGPDQHEIRQKWTTKL